MACHRCGFSFNARVGFVPAVLAASMLAAVVIVLAVLAGRNRGPTPSDYTILNDLPTTRVVAAMARPGSSNGSFTSACGNNANGHHNEDNIVTMPGISGGAHHTHDYVGNVSVDAFSTAAKMVAAATTCTNNDRSTYFWPVLRLIDDATPPGGPPQHAIHINAGSIQRPQVVAIRFTGNGFGKVVPMPRFLRMGTGDATAFTHPTRFVKATWGCAGTPDVLTDQYPLCPDGRLTRTFDFPSCWDGLRIDSPDHRSHLEFTAADGACPKGWYPIPRLEITIRYALPPGEPYAVDSFPEQRRKPETDHSFFVNVMTETQMATATRCINDGHAC